MKTNLHVQPPAAHRKPSLPTLAMAATAVAASSLVSACRMQGAVVRAPAGVPLAEPTSVEPAVPGGDVRPSGEIPAEPTSVELAVPDGDIRPPGGIRALPPPVSPVVPPPTQPTAGVPRMDTSR